MLPLFILSLELICLFSTISSIKLPSNQKPIFGRLPITMETNGGSLGSLQSALSTGNDLTKTKTASTHSDCTHFPVAGSE